MIRDLNLSDLPRQLLPGRLSATDLACRRGTLNRPAHQLTQMELVRWSISSKAQHSLVAVDGAQLDAVARLRTRRGPRAWEIAHLFASHRGMATVDQLLDRCVACVGARGGERLFLRVAYRSPVQDVARRAGFYPAFTEELFRLNRSLSPTIDPPTLGMRPALPADTYGLFRLHNATMPASIRAAAGLTLDQWMDAREEPEGFAREYVWSHDETVRGWLCLDHKADELTIEAMLHPDDGDVAATLVGEVGRLAWGHNWPSWVVPSYSPALSRVLQRRGWELHDTYAMLVRPVASRVREPALTPVQA